MYVHENTFTRAKNYRLGITASGWSIEIRKNTLNRVGKINAHYVHHSSLKLEKLRVERRLLWGRRIKWAQPHCRPQSQHMPVPGHPRVGQPRYQANSCGPGWLPTGSFQAMFCSPWHSAYFTAQGGSCGTRLPTDSREPSRLSYPPPEDSNGHWQLL